LHSSKASLPRPLIGLRERTATGKCQDVVIPPTVYQLSLDAGEACGLRADALSPIGLG